MLIVGFLFRKSLINERKIIDKEERLLKLDWEVSYKSAISMIGGGIFLILIYILQIISKCF